MKKCLGALGALLIVAFMAHQAAAASFFLDGTTLPPDTNAANDNVNGNAKVVGDYDWYTNTGTTVNFRPNQPVANNQTPLDSDTRVVQGDAAVPNVIGQYAPLGAGNKGIYMASKGSGTNNGTNGTLIEYEYQMGNAVADQAQTLGARFQILKVNNASVPTDGFTGTGTTATNPGLGFLELGAGGNSPFIALTVTDDANDHYFYRVDQVRPAANYAILRAGSPATTALNSQAGANNTSQTSGGWMDAWLYSDNTGKAEVMLFDEAANAVVFHDTYLALTGTGAGNFGSAFFGAQLAELTGAGNTYGSSVYDAVRLWEGNQVGAAIVTVPEPSSIVMTGFGLIGLVGYGLRKRSRQS